jgi:hypothetical protein
VTTNIQCVLNKLGEDLVVSAHVAGGHGSKLGGRSVQRHRKVFEQGNNASGGKLTFGTCAGYNRG